MKDIAPRPRNNIDQTYYTAGRASPQSPPVRFSKHMAEPGEAGTILSRNPHHSAEYNVKPILCQAPVTDRFNPEVLSLHLAKQVQKREFSNQARQVANCSQTVTKENFSEKVQEKAEVPTKDFWLYCSRSKPYNVKAEDAFKVTEQTPDWFQIAKKNDVSNKNETLTVFSRLNGWIYVSAESRNRKHRLGKSGPFKEGETANYQKVSSLAPIWMQREANSVPNRTKHNMKPPPFLRQEQNRMILVDDAQPEKSIYSFGDFRHDIRTSDEVALYNRSVAQNPKNFFEWKEDVKRQKYDKPVADKIGARIN